MFSFFIVLKTKQHRRKQSPKDQYISSKYHILFYKSHLIPRPSGSETTLFAEQTPLITPGQSPGVININHALLSDPKQIATNQYPGFCSRLPICTSRKGIGYTNRPGVTI